MGAILPHVIIASMNRLAREHSPYLLQHAEQSGRLVSLGRRGVRARAAENKPIFLSIGYSTCHWCHVMAHESFENPTSPRVLNEQFVSDQGRSGGAAGRRSRVHDVRAGDDRFRRLADERLAHAGPEAVLRRHLLPAGRRDGAGPGSSISSPRSRACGTSEREKVAEIGRCADRAAARRRAGAPSAGSCPARARSKRTVAQFREAFDRATRRVRQRAEVSAPERAAVPAARARADAATPTPRDMALATLRAMALGGMRDHIGGGFHRYSVDAAWRVPHFEKMLYDQAQLVLAFLEGAQVSAIRSIADVAEDTLRYVLREMTDEAGGFYSAEDADSVPPEERGRGRRPHDGGRVLSVARRASSAPLVGEDAPIVQPRFGIEENGNAPADPQQEFTGKNLLYVARSVEEIAGDLAEEPGRGRAPRSTARRLRLFERRVTRPRPHLDDKVLTAWNGLMIAAFARAARVMRLGPARTRSQRISTPRGGRHRSFATACGTPKRARCCAAIAGGEAEYRGLRGRLRVLNLRAARAVPGRSGSRAGSSGRWCSSAARTSCSGTSVDGGWFSTTGTDPTVLLRMKEDYDGAEPTASSVSVLNLLSSRICSRSRGGPIGSSGRSSPSRSRLEQIGRGVPMMASALSAQLSGMRQIVIVGDESADGELSRRAGQRVPAVCGVSEPVAGAAEALASKLPFIASMTPVAGVAGCLRLPPFHLPGAGYRRRRSGTRAGRIVVSHVAAGFTRPSPSA